VKRGVDLLGSALVIGVKVYQRVVSPLLPRSCKYHPTCSQYAVDAIKEFGVMRGVVLAAWRLLRCNPMSYGGYDPVEQQRLFGRRDRDRAALGMTGRV
jgi:putative membrane protein insertion efficiency factor